MSKHISQDTPTCQLHSSDHLLLVPQGCQLGNYQVEGSSIAGPVLRNGLTGGHFHFLLSANHVKQMWWNVNMGGGVESGCGVFNLGTYFHLADVLFYAFAACCCFASHLETKKISQDIYILNNSLI